MTTTVYPNYLPMHTLRETVLSVIPGSLDDERLLVVHRHQPNGGSRIELRQQTFGEGVGWFTQSSVVIEPEQLAALQGALGGSAKTAPRPTSAARRGQGSHLRIAHAESA